MVDRFESLAMNMLSGSNAEEDSAAIEIIKQISKFYRKKEEIDKSKKLTLTLDLWIEMSKRKVFQKYSTVAHALSKQFKAYRIVSSKSILYPMNIKFISANPLSSCFVHSKFTYYDRVLDYRDALLENIQDKNSQKEDVLLSIYTYLKVFHLEQIPLKYFKEIKKENLVSIPKRTLLIFSQNTTEDFKPINIFMLDKQISKALEICIQEDFGIFSGINLDMFDQKARNHIKKELPNLSLYDIRKIIQLEFQIKNSPLSLTIMMAKKYPKLHLHEIEYMYEGSIKQELLDIENNNIRIYRKKINNQQINEKKEVVNKSYFQQNLEVYDELKVIVNIPFEKKEFNQYLKKWHNFIDVHSKKEEDGFLLKILQFTKILISKADKDIAYKPIKPKTLKEYLRISFNFAFKYIVAEGEINNDVIRSIDIGIIYNDNLSLVSQRKYKRVINIFLKNMTQFDSLKKIQSATSINRSMVFKEELDELVKMLINSDKVGSSDEAPSNYIITHKRAVFLLLLYYSGVRKEELRTRLSKDLIAIGNNDFSLNINNEGLKKQKKAEYDKGNGLKTTSSKRRVRFKISDQEHLYILKTYLTFIEKHKTLFLFPSFTIKINRNKVYKKQIMPEDRILEINKLLQDVTGRYTPIHTLRHSYATNKVKYMYDSEYDNIEDMFELAEQIGHSGPGVTNEFYVHIGVLKLQLETFNI